MKKKTLFLVLQNKKYNKGHLHVDEIDNIDKMNKFLEKHTTKPDSRKNKKNTKPITLKDFESVMKNLCIRKAPTQASVPGRSQSNNYDF